MPWKLINVNSIENESPGEESKIGFRGSRYSIGLDGNLFVTDFNQQKTNHIDASEYVTQIRRILNNNSWAGRLRIRGNGDTYCKDDGNIYYVGNTNTDNNEYFPGYNFNQKPKPGSPEPSVVIFSGSHNHGMVGERWTIPERSFAIREGVSMGNVGRRIRKGEWVWSSSQHDEFTETLRSLFRLEDFIRFYITAEGNLVRPIAAKYWTSYGIDINSQIKSLLSHSPMAGNSVNTKIENSKTQNREPNLYFCFGNINDLLNGKIPTTSQDDRDNDVDQDSSKWG